MVLAFFGKGIYHGGTEGTERIVAIDGKLANPVPRPTPSLLCELRASVVYS
jgi:hypothetical protein